MKTHLKKFAIPVFAALLMLLIPQISSAQKEKDQQRREKIYAMKVAYITQRLALTSNESEKFWPVYREYQDARTALQKKYRPAIKLSDATALAALSDTDAATLIDAELEKDKKLLEIKQEYVTRFVKIIGAKKVLMLHLAEKEFNKLLLEKLKDRKGKGNTSTE
jgi:hypothetical protein